MRMEPRSLPGKKSRIPGKSSGLSRLSNTSSHRSLHLDRTSLTEATTASALSNTREGSSCLAAVSIDLYRGSREEASSQSIAPNLQSLSCDGNIQRQVVSWPCHPSQ